MNKKRVDELIPKAVDVLENRGIANEKKEIVKTYRGQISTFGAAITNGSLISAVAFFSVKGESDVDRSALMKAVYDLIAGEGTEGTLFTYVQNAGKVGEAKVKEEIINATIALKLAMNLYKLI